MALPPPDVLQEFFSLKSETNNRYLRFIHQHFDGVHGLLQFSGEDVVSPYTKFHAVTAPGPHNTLMVNIQSCYNNKYLRADREDQNQGWIVAGADEPQHDQTVWNCTLFEPFINGAQIHLRHVASSYFLKISRINECLLLSPDFDVFTVIDWNVFLILPKHLAFKGDDGSYISVNRDPAEPYLHFADTVPTDETVENEVFPSPAGDGSVCIYSTYKQKFWTKTERPPFASNAIDSWIWADVNDIADTDAASFWPAKVDDDVVVTLRNSGNICKRLNGYLNAGPRVVHPPWTHLEVELAKSRTISILKFHALTDARIYNRTIDRVVAFESAQNPTQNPASKTIWLTYEDTKASTWNTSTEDLAFSAIIPTTLTSATPFIVGEGRIDISDNFNGTYQWGSRHTSSTPIRRRFQVVVPALSSVTVRLLATEASCDIPFNYSKNDTLISQRTTHNEEVGLYTGVSLYNFHHKEETRPL